MKKIFNESRLTVQDKGFSDEVMAEIATLKRPSMNTYRTPTFIAAAAVASVIVILSLAVGLDVMTERYENLAFVITTDVSNETIGDAETDISSYAEQSLE